VPYVSNVVEGFFDNRASGSVLALSHGVSGTLSHTALGILGESIARRELEARGYAVLATRYRTRFGEIDIVCLHRGAVVFVEVKARTRAAQGSAAESIAVWKRRRLGAMALDYLAWTNRTRDVCRFDVVAIDRIGSEDMTVTVIEDAFQIE
jgi:putative endonuclease